MAKKAQPIEIRIRDYGQDCERANIKEILMKIGLGIVLCLLFLAVCVLFGLLAQYTKDSTLTPFWAGFFVAALLLISIINMIIP